MFNTSIYEILKIIINTKFKHLPIIKQPDLKNKVSKKIKQFDNLTKNMQEEYTRINEGDSEKQTAGGIMTAVTKKMKEYMFDKQELQQSKVDQLSQYKKPVFMVSDMESTFINMKRSFQYVGDNSTFQKRITLILAIQWIAFSFMVNSIAFFFKTPVFLCKVPLTDIFIVCTQAIACPLINTDFVKIRTSSTDQFFSFYQVSISQEFNLYCDNSDRAPWAQSAFFFGGFISGYLFSYISQRIGRRLNLLFILIMMTVSIIYCALVPTFQLFTIGYFFIGFCLFGYETSIYIYIGQISAIRFRTISINILTMTWAGTPIFLPLLGLFPTWRHTFMFFALILLFTIPLAYYCFLESPRFLLSKKCYAKARQIFQKISITNRRPPYNFKLVQEIEQENSSYLTYTESALATAEFLTAQLIPVRTKGYGYFDLFKYPSLKKPTLVLMYWWTFRFFMYYGLNLALESVLKSSFLLTLIISGAAIMQVLGSFGIPIMTTFCYNNYKLDIMRISLMITTICCVFLWFLQIGPDCVVMASQNQLCLSLILMLILVILIKFFNTVFFSGLLVYYSQVFPTPVRSLGCGFTLTFGRLGTILVPFYINYMKMKYYGKNSLCYMAPFGLLAILLCYLMPYTQKQGMKEKIKEQENQNVFQLNTL